MTTKRYLTKSLFKLGCVCPTKLFYSGRPDEYANQSVEDSFLMALADGGFQVGELAKCYFPGGIEMRTLNYETAEVKTKELLQRDNVVIFEAALRFENLFIRVDVLVKSGNSLHLIEVKSSSWDPANDSFLNKRDGTIKSGMLPLLYDIAFQKYVAAHAFPDHSITASLMLIDKSSICPTDGLHQKIRIVKDENGRKRAQVVSELTEEDLSQKLLVEVPVDECCELVFAGTDTKVVQELSFDERVKLFAEKTIRGEKIVAPIGPICKKCEFRTDPEDTAKGLKSGFYECWGEALGWTPEECDEQTVLDIWNFRKKESLMQAGRVKMTQVAIDDIDPKADKSYGLSASQRQWLQIEKYQNGDASFHLDAECLKEEMDSWTFPLHFIDFETAAPAIPFNRGMRPYEGIAFQFSHHIVHADGRIEHAGEYLNTEPGKFPNFEFIRALKSELEQDSGSIFRYAAHENSFVTMIHRQLEKSSEDIPDREELMEFIRSISKSGNDSARQWTGERNMIDLLELVKRYYYDPYMKGSNSIKHVLPAILHSSEYLRFKYSQPVYGAADGIVSRNFKDWCWVQTVDNKVVDPYKLLPKMFQDASDEDLEVLSEDEIRDGGAAMTAYTRLQFEDMSDYERGAIRAALLKYCELDTMAMVLIYEGWVDLIRG